MAVIIISIASGALSSMFYRNKQWNMDSENVDSESRISNVLIWHIGSSNKLLGNVLSKLRVRGASIAHFDDFPTPTNISEQMLIIFDGDRISNSFNSYKTCMFLRIACNRSARLIAIGGSASEPLVALNKCEIHRLPRDEEGNVRNPLTLALQW